MARSKKSLVATKKVVKHTRTEVISPDDKKKILLFIKLVEIVKNSTNKEKSDNAFNEIITLIEPKIQKISYKFQIPGYSRLDIYQEALFALRYKAIKDYDQKRSNCGDISPFDRFAILCIRRHLSTKLKASYQNKSRVLNSSVSLDQNRNDSSDNDDLLFLSDVISSLDTDASVQYLNREHYKLLFSKLASKLSEFEKEVFIYYSQKLSYEEIVERINRKNNRRIKVNKKSIDNSLSRIKQKAKEVFQKYKDI
jgi:RNA polymerase sporulation-specific sigma factor